MTDPLSATSPKIAFNGSHDWAVCKRGGRWRIYHRRHNDWVWTLGMRHFATLPEAHSEATRNAVADELYAPGGLKRLAIMRQIVDSYRQYAEPLAQWEIELRDSFNEQLAAKLHPPTYCLRCGIPHTTPCKRGTK
jgi:hypothetical protein